jgi:dihydrodipicolinate synthase/N-acetylneuraminate lyase
MILRIRDADGNVQEILAIRGKDGEGYVLTEADKKEIAEMVRDMIQSEA